MIMEELAKSGGAFEVIEEKVNAVSGCSRQLGIVIGLGDAAKALFAKASKSFEEGDDDRARLTRELAREIVQIAENKRKVIKSDREAWDSLASIITAMEEEFAPLANAVEDYRKEVARLNSILGEGPF